MVAIIINNNKDKKSLTKIFVNGPNALIFSCGGISGHTLSVPLVLCIPDTAIKCRGIHVI